MLILLSLMTALTLCGCKSADYDRAAGLFRQAEPYRDASGRAEEAVQAGREYRYQQAMALKDAGKTGEAALALYHLGDYRDARQQYFALYAAAHRCTLAAGEYHNVGLKSDGMLHSTGNNYNGEGEVADWTDIRLPIS